MSLFDEDTVKCKAALCDRHATIMTPDGPACGEHCPEEHRPTPPKGDDPDVPPELQGNRRKR